MPDDWGLIFGKLHRLEDTRQLPQGPAVQVVPLTNQRQLAPFVPPTTNRERHNYVNLHHEAQKAWLEDYHAEEACKNLIITIVDKVYSEELWDEQLGYI